MLILRVKNVFNDCFSCSAAGKLESARELRVDVMVALLFIPQILLFEVKLSEKQVCTCFPIPKIKQLFKI
jgi:hypothetical protein